MIVEEKFDFNASIKRKIIIAGLAGVVLLMVGILLLNLGGGHHEAQEHAVAGHEHLHASASTHEAPSHSVAGHHEGTAIWLKRLYANLWINNVYFTGISIIGVFFFAIQYVAQAGWSAGLKRIPQSFGAWLPFAGVGTLIIFLLGGHDLFHWTHHYLYHEGPLYDAIIDGKKGYFFWPLTEPTVPVFYLARIVVFFTVWYLMFVALRKEMYKEDITGGTKSWHRMVFLSAIFIIFFAVSSSIAAWDWVMSIDTHWFSTMFGWYVFASWFITGLAFTTYVVVALKENGYLKVVNANHIHDLGKFVFGFSVFWTYIWFAQFMLIYYANIPEETVYFVERLSRSNYVGIFFANLFLNFVFPFLLLMPRDAKRQGMILKVVAVIVMIGHWFDFYLMVTPGVLKENGGVGFIEIGTFLIFGSAFLFCGLECAVSKRLIRQKSPDVGRKSPSSHLVDSPSIKQIAYHVEFTHWFRCTYCTGRSYSGFQNLVPDERWFRYFGKT